MLTVLAEKLMNIGELIQINTDGLTLKLKRSQIDEYYQICKDWEKITKLTLEYAEYSKMIIRDVSYGVLTSLIDWNSLRASYTPCSSNDYII